MAEFDPTQSSVQYGEALLASQQKERGKWKNRSRKIKTFKKVLGAIGVPVEGLALIFGVDRILDMMRTVVNVTGDATVATVVASTEGQLSPVSDTELMS